MPKVTVELAEDVLIAALRQLPPDRRRVLLNELAAGEPIVAKPISGEELAQWKGSMAVGGDALVDSERLYDE